MPTNIASDGGVKMLRLFESSNNNVAVVDNDNGVWGQRDDHSLTHKLNLEMQKVKKWKPEKSYVHANIEFESERTNERGRMHITER